jgi:hypothetical protein
MQDSDEDIVRQYLSRGDYVFDAFFTARGKAVYFYDESGKIMRLLIEVDEMANRCVKVLRSLGREFETVEQAKHAYINSGGIPWLTRAK